MAKKSKQELQDMMREKEEKKEEKEEKPEEEGKKEVEEEEKFEKKVKGALEGKSDAPSKEQIERWKAEYGNVYASAFSEEEVFIWRVLSRAEHRNIQLKLSRINRDDFSQVDYEEMVVDLMMLWPSPEADEEKYQKLTMKAGTYSSLYEQIMQASNFISGPMANLLMAEL
jgi:hypothetical protein